MSAAMPDGADVIVAEEMALVRDGLVSLLSAGRGGGAVQGVATVEAGVHSAQASRAASCVLLLDYGLLGAAGAAGLRAVRARMPQVAILVLAMREDREAIVQCLEAGARGYVGEDGGIGGAVAGGGDRRGGGGWHVPPGLAEPGSAVWGGFGAEGARPVPDARAVSSLLTGRQRDVLMLMAEGAVDEGHRPDARPGGLDDQGSSGRGLPGRGSAETGWRRCAGRGCCRVSRCSREPCGFRRALSGYGKKRRRCLRSGRETVPSRCNAARSRSFKMNRSAASALATQLFAASLIVAAACGAASARGRARQLRGGDGEPGLHDRLQRPRPRIR